MFVFVLSAMFAVAMTSADDLRTGRIAPDEELTILLRDDALCLAPETLPIEMPIQAFAVERRVAVAHAGDFAAWMPDRADNEGVTSADEDIARLFGDRGLPFALIAIFLFGLTLNLTPCVYPMLTVTVSIFGGSSDAYAVRSFLKASVYVLGVATMYSLLGTVAALTGGLFGALMQSPWVLAIIAALLATLALSMFGLYEIRVPAALMNRLGRAGAGVGWIGVFVSGLVVGIFAAPCIGPPIVALLTLVGTRGDPWFGFGSFFVLSLGLGAPYLFLGTFSGLLKRLPRSGEWMLWVRKVFGVVLLAVAAFYAALGFAPDLLIWTPVAGLLAGGLYLGFLERSGNDRRTFRRFKQALGVAAVVGGVALAIAEHRHTPTEWEPYASKRLAEAVAKGRPVVIDFYADWCIYCHELERRTFGDPDVQRALANHIKLRVDLTRMDSPESKAFMRKFDIQGVPTVVFLDAAGRERPNSRVMGFLPPRSFLERAGF